MTAGGIKNMAKLKRKYFVNKTCPHVCQQWLHAALNTANASMDQTINYDANTWARVVGAVNNNKMRV